MSVPEGQRISDTYEFLEQIGEGSFARVYRGRDRRTGELVALKVLKESMRGNADVVARFRREVLAVSSIKSPHVVALRDFGFLEQETYLAMELVVGTTLRDVLNTVTWTARDAHVIIGQIAEALSVAHAQSITHRDLKPENVMLALGEDGAQSVKVVDFGLVKIQELDQSVAQLSVAGMVYGTPHYLSPEVIYGEPADPAVDLFALAIIAYELVAQHRPWNGTQTAEVIRAIATQPVPEITAVPAELAGRLADINAFFARALAKEAGDRPRDAAALFLAFGEALFGEKLARPADGGDAFFEITHGTISLPSMRVRGQGDVEVALEADFDLSKTVADPIDRGSSERLSASWIESLPPTRAIRKAPPLEPVAPAESVEPVESTESLESTAPAEAVQVVELLEPVELVESLAETLREAGTSSYPRYRGRRRRWPLVLGVALALVMTAALGFLLGARYGALR